MVQNSLIDLPAQARRDRLQGYEVARKKGSLGDDGEVDGPMDPFSKKLPSHIATDMD